MDEAELRKIDALVAERVMGWKFSPQTTALATIGEYYIASRSGEVMVMLDFGCEEWNPAASPADAMAVLKRVLEKAPSFAVERVGPELSATGNIAYECGSFENGIYHRETVVVEPSLELAICKFALKLFS